jgi:diadenosine tetraphosphate (Ap4A) HIT family hydrolase
MLLNKWLLEPSDTIHRGDVMRYEELVDFIENRMLMSHVYQPLMIRALVDCGGSATIHQLAHAFLGQDESQLLFYEKRIKEMPLKVLTRRGVTATEGQLVSLTVSRLTLEQKANIRMLCEQRLQSFVKKRGIGIWDYRLLDDAPVSDNLRFTVLKAAGGRCQLCGISAKEMPLDVDHIIPRSRGGRTVLENLQALCSKCNRTKGNQDETDFRFLPGSETIPSCAFCDSGVNARIVERSNLVFAIEDAYPVTPGHLLVIPNRHTPDFFSMTENERQNANELLRVLQGQIRERDRTVNGFNIGMNCGESAGQTVNHAHIHLIPRRIGDLEDPRGGVRGVIPERRIY